MFWRNFFTSFRIAFCYFAYKRCKKNIGQVKCISCTSCHLKLVIPLFTAHLYSAIMSKDIFTHLVKLLLLWTLSLWLHSLNLSLSYCNDNGLQYNKSFIDLIWECLKAIESWPNSLPWYISLMSYNYCPIQ